MLPKVKKVCYPKLRCATQSKKKKVCYPKFAADVEAKESYGPNQMFKWMELPSSERLSYWVTKKKDSRTG